MNTEHITRISRITLIG